MGRLGGVLDGVEELAVERDGGGADEAVCDGAGEGAGAVCATGVLRLQAAVMTSTAKNETFLMFLVNNEVGRNSTSWLQILAQSASRKLTVMVVITSTGWPLRSVGWYSHWPTAASACLVSSG